MRWVVVVLAFAGGFFGGFGSQESQAVGGGAGGGACATLVCMTGYSMGCPQQQPGQTTRHNVPGGTFRKP